MPSPIDLIKANDPGLQGPAQAQDEGKAKRNLSKHASSTSPSCHSNPDPDKYLGKTILSLRTLYKHAGMKPSHRPRHRKQFRVAQIPTKRGVGATAAAAATSSPPLTLPLNKAGPDFSTTSSVGAYSFGKISGLAYDSERATPKSQQQLEQQQPPSNPNTVGVSSQRKSSSPPPGSPSVGDTLARGKEHRQFSTRTTARPASLPTQSRQRRMSTATEGKPRLRSVRGKWKDNRLSRDGRRPFACSGVEQETAVVEGRMSTSAFPHNHHMHATATDTNASNNIDVPMESSLLLPFDEPSTYVTNCRNPDNPPRAEPLPLSTPSSSSKHTKLSLLSSSVHEAVEVCTHPGYSHIHHDYQPPSFPPPLFNSRVPSLGTISTSLKKAVVDTNDISTNRTRIMATTTTSLATGSSSRNSTRS